jgi:hypothetical protein
MLLNGPLRRLTCHDLNVLRNVDQAAQAGARRADGLPELRGDAEDGMD